MTTQVAMVSPKTLDGFPAQLTYRYCHQIAHVLIKRLETSVCLRGRERDSCKSEYWSSGFLGIFVAVIYGIDPKCDVKWGGGNGRGSKSAVSLPKSHPSFH